LTAFSQKHQNRRAKKPADEHLLNAITWLVNHYQCDGVLDFGAGYGRYTEALRACGIAAEGCDASEGQGTKEHPIAQVDLTAVGSGALWRVNNKDMDRALRICIEVGEHVKPDDTRDFLINVFNKYNWGPDKDKVLLSWAVPNQRGRGHINCKLPEELLFLITSWNLGFFDVEATKKVREIAGKNWSNRLMVFKCQ
jgi:SAM-dependent methyltransferase